MNDLSEAMRRASAREAESAGLHAIERELDPRELEAALDDAIAGVALALLDRARAIVTKRITQRRIE